MYKNKKSLIIEWAREHVKGPSLALNTDQLFAASNLVARLKPGARIARHTTFVKAERLGCRLVTAVSNLHIRNSAGGRRQWAEVGLTTGATRFTFEQAGERFSCVFVAWEHGGKFETLAVVAVPYGRVAVWSDFSRHLHSLIGIKPSRKKAYVLGSGTTSEFKPTFRLPDVILPQALKHDIVTSIDGFYSGGLAAYLDLKVPPFRKYLLYGKPGNGKSMLTQALAADQMAKGRVVIYISASDQYGASFGKVQQATAIAVEHRFPVFVVIEELDAYVASEETAAQVLDYLDGFEAPVNGRGTVLLATTNYPERLQDRILRFGRIDRKWLIPDIQNADEARALLVHYLADYHPTQDDWFIEQHLLNRPRVFVRELTFTARMMAAREGQPVNQCLLESIRQLDQQLQAGEDFQREGRSAMQFGPRRARAQAPASVEDEIPF